MVQLRQLQSSGEHMPPRMPQTSHPLLDPREDLLTMLQNDTFFKRFDIAFARLGETTRFASTKTSTLAAKLESSYLEQNISLPHPNLCGYDLHTTVGLHHIVEWAIKNGAEALESYEALHRSTKRRKREISGSELNLRRVILDMFEGLAKRFADVRRMIDDSVVRLDGAHVDKALYRALCDVLRQSAACYDVLKDEICAALEGMGA